MLNAEKYKDELKSLNDVDKLWYSAFNKRNMTFGSCLDVKCENCAFNGGKGCNNARYNWLLSEYIEHIEVSEFEYNILKYLSDNTKYMYIARDKSGSLEVYTSKPDKLNDSWGRYNIIGDLNVFNELFQFVQWSDEEPTLIEEVLKNCEVVDDDHE